MHLKFLGVTTATTSPFLKRQPYWQNERDRSTQKGLLGGCTFLKRTIWLSVRDFTAGGSSGTCIAYGTAYGCCARQSIENLEHLTQDSCSAGST